MATSRNSLISSSTAVALGLRGTWVGVRVAAARLSPGRTGGVGVLAAGVDKVSIRLIAIAIPVDEYPPKPGTVDTNIRSVREALTPGVVVEHTIPVANVMEVVAVQAGARRRP